MAAVPAAHARGPGPPPRLLENAIRENGGYVFQIVGDAFCAAFATATAALAAAADAQRALLAENWQDIEPLQARMGVHAGPAEVNEADLRAGQYASSLTLSRAARLMAAAHGGQVLVSAAVEALASDYLPAGLGLRDLGVHRLKDVVLPERIYQLTAPDLPDRLSPRSTRPTPRPPTSRRSLRRSSGAGRDRADYGDACARKRCAC